MTNIIGCLVYNPPSPQEQCQTSGDHLKAGIIGLSSGVFGGVTSIFTQPYRGAVESGVGVHGGRGDLALQMDIPTEIFHS